MALEQKKYFESGRRAEREYTLALLAERRERYRSNGSEASAEAINDVIETIVNAALADGGINV